MWRSHSCCEATNAGGECGGATNVAKQRMPEANVLKHECSRAANVGDEGLAEFSSIRFAFEVLVFNVSAFVSNVFTFC